MNSKIYQDELTASVSQQNKVTDQANTFLLGGVSPMSFRHSTTPLLEANKIVRTKKKESAVNSDSLLEQYKNETYEAPNLKPLRVIGHGAFGKFTFL
jgi:hypothetical protein